MGVAVTSWTYIWRTTPIYRSELEGTLEADLPPELPSGVSHEEVQRPRDGAGPLFHRLYSASIRDTNWDAAGLIECVRADPNRVAPLSLARFQKTRGEQGEMQVGDEWLVRMPGPWDGPVRTIEVGSQHFRFATLAGHLEAGQIEWRAHEDDGLLRFQIESWARAGDRLSALMHDRLRMAKEVQLHMWSSVVEKVADLTGGALERGIEIETRRVDGDAFD
ncbi:MAG: hypothetical protein QOD66_1330 [Solirubrobacteraceae bacterium]|nr:hypothetical protein [Solirubrobacteraceae bacterium]